MARWGGDELNLLSAGRNYGWPEVTFGRNYDGNIVSLLSDRDGIDAPSLYWKPSIAVCGIDFVRGDLFPRWRNQLLVGGLKFEEVRLLTIRGDRVLHQEIILKNAVHPQTGRGEIFGGAEPHPAVVVPVLIEPGLAEDLHHRECLEAWRSAGIVDHI